MRPDFIFSLAPMRDQRALFFVMKNRVVLAQLSMLGSITLCPRADKDVRVKVRKDLLVKQQPFGAVGI